MCNNQLPLDKLPYDKIYDDLVHPTAEAVGVVLSLPARYVRQKLSNLEKFILEGERNLNQISETISEKMADVDPKNIIEPEPYIAVPALQGISYCMDNNELRNLYANLLATAMQKDKKDSVLPAFAEIIKQMSPTDAVLMKNLSTNDMYPLAEARYQKITPSSFASPKVLKSLVTGVSLFQNLSDVLREKYSINDIAISIENLSRLGLIVISDTYIQNEHAYDNIATMPCCIEWCSSLEVAKSTSVIPEHFKILEDRINDFEFALIPKSFFMTNFGRLFFNTCVR